MKIINKKRLAVLLASVLLLVVTVGGTIAFLVASTDPLVNTFTPASVDVTVTDEIEDGVKKDVVIKNTGSTSAYIRARIVGSWVDNGIVVKAWETSDGTFIGLPGDGWVQRGEFYYYTQPVLPQGTTAPLFTSYTITTKAKPTPTAYLEMDILVQAIQAEGGAAAVWGGIPTPKP